MSVVSSWRKEDVLESVSYFKRKTNVDQRTTDFDSVQLKKVYFCGILNDIQAEMTDVKTDVDIDGSKITFAGPKDDIDDFENQIFKALATRLEEIDVGSQEVLSSYETKFVAGALKKNKFEHHHH